MYYLIKKTLEECAADDIRRGDAQYVAVLTKAEWAGERERFEAFRGIAKREFIGALKDAVQYGIAEPGCARRYCAYEFDALVDGSMGLLAQIDDLVGGNAQRIAHIGLDVARACQAAVDDLVERAGGADDAKREQRGECPVGRRDG